jgi:hypothetical protein
MTKQNQQNLSLDVVQALRELIEAVELLEESHEDDPKTEANIVQTAREALKALNALQQTVSKNEDPTPPSVTFVESMNLLLHEAQKKVRAKLRSLSALRTSSLVFRPWPKGLFVSSPFFFFFSLFVKTGTFRIGRKNSGFDV